MVAWSTIAEGGAPSRSSAFIRFRANMKAGGRKYPLALMAHTKVTLVPLSVLEILLTHLFPFIDITFGGLLGTVDMPVSSILNIA